MLKNEACRTLVKNENSAPIWKDKKKFKTFEDALFESRRLNNKPTTIHKFEAYKCKTCLRFHVGRTNKILVHKVDLYKNPSN